MHDWQTARHRMRILRKGEDADGSEVVTVDHYDAGLEIHLPEHGVFTVEHGGAPIFLEHYQGKFQLLVWADINQEDPTHYIDLSGALEERREK